MNRTFFPYPLLVLSIFLSILLSVSSWAEGNGGVSDTLIDSKIVGGETSNSGDWPWMVALLERNMPDANEGQFCGGSLVHPYWVVSAAHCLIGRRPQEIDVLIGAVSLTNTISAQRLAVEEIILHPDYNDSTLESDIALLRLTTSVSPVPELLPLIDDATLDAVGVMATVIGWGATNGLGVAFVPSLMETQLPIVDLAVANGPASHNGGLTSDMLPSGFAAGGKAACTGDSGGPLMVPSPFPPGWMLAGIVSFSKAGVDCAAANNYPICTRVLNFRDFINNYITPYYGAFEVEQGVVGQDRDPDGDLVPNFLEFAYRSDPNLESAADMSASVLVSTVGGAIPGIRYRRPMKSDDVSYGVEYTDDLLTGFIPYDLLASLHSTEPVPGDPGAEEYTVFSPSGFNPAMGFLRSTAVASPNLVNGKRHLAFPGGIQGSLTDEDLEHPTLVGHFKKEYDLQDAPEGQPITVTLRSSEFAALLEIVDGDSGTVLFSDTGNSGGGTDDKITFTPGAGTNYCLRVTSTSSSEVGLYGLAAFVIDGSLPVLGVPDAAVGTLATSDPFDPIFLPGMEYYKDDFVLNHSGGTNLQVTLTSASFDVFLSIYNAENGAFIINTDDFIADANGAGGTESKLNFTPQDGVSYYVRVSSSNELETGSYAVSTDVAPLIESVVEGSLASSDDVDPNLVAVGTFYIDDYDLTGVSSGDRVVLDQMAFSDPLMDSFLQLIDKATGGIIANGNNYGTNENSRIIFTVQAGISYVVRVSSLFAEITGGYRLSAQFLPTLSVPQERKRILTLNDGLENGTFLDTFHIDDYDLTGVSAGQSITVTMSSVEVDALIFLLDRKTGVILQEDDNSGGDLDARLTFTVQPGVDYLIRAATFGENEIGHYTLTTETP